jgi:dihydropteroate synthase
VSRKSFLYRFFEDKPENMLNATTVMNTISLLKGVNIIRVHDVKEAVEAVKLVQKTLNA